MRSSQRVQRGSVVGAARRAGAVPLGDLPPIDKLGVSLRREEVEAAKRQLDGSFDARRCASGGGRTDPVPSPREPLELSDPGPALEEEEDYGGDDGREPPAGDESPVAALLTRLADEARHRIVVERNWHFEFSGGRHFDRLPPRLQVCLVGDWLRGFLRDLPGCRHAASLGGRSFWGDCVLHALLKSLNALVEEELAADDGAGPPREEWRLTATSLWAAATDGARAPVDAGSADPGEWRVLVDCLVAEFLANATARKVLSGAVAVEDCGAALAAALSGSYAADVDVDGGALLGPCLVPRRTWTARDLREANALVAALAGRNCAEADLFEPVGWQAAKPEDDVRYRPFSRGEERGRIGRVREAVDMMREAERTAGAARETARDLVEAAEQEIRHAKKKAKKGPSRDALEAAKRRLAHARDNVDDAQMLWKEQCHTLCEGVGLLLRALAHAQDDGWVRALADALRVDDPRGPLAAKVDAFDVAKSKLSCADATFSEFEELQDYLVACHSICAPAPYLWAHLKCRPGEEEDDGADDVDARVGQLELDADSPRAPLEARLAAHRRA